MDWPDWAGDLPTWITTIAVLLAVMQFLVERGRRRDEVEREAKSQASRLTAWVAINLIGQARQSYGVVISNTSGSTFHDVTLRVRIHGDEAPPLTLSILPPGTYYVRHDPKNPYTWEFAEHASVPEGTLRPYMKSDKYQLLEIRFADNLGQRWVSDSRALLQRVSDDGSASPAT